MVAIYTLVNMVYLCNMYRKGGFKNVQQIAYFIVISALMLIFSVERAVFMLLDAYNLHGTIHPLAAYLFISIGLPCMTSCFFLIFHAFYKASRSRLATKSIFSIKALVAVIVVHFGVSLTLDIAAGFDLYPVYLLLICQSIFVACGITFAIMFLVLFVRMYRQSVSQRRKMIRIAAGMSGISEKTTSDGNESGEIPEKSDLKRTQNSLKAMPQPKVTIGGKLILASAILLLLVSVLYLYGIIGIYVKHAMTGEPLDLWLWWSWEFAVRILEVCLCWTISLAGTQPLMRGFRKIRSTRRRRQEVVQDVWRERRASEAISLRKASVAGDKTKKTDLTNAEKIIRSEEYNIGYEEDGDKPKQRPPSERRVSFSITGSSEKMEDTLGQENGVIKMPQHEIIHEVDSVEIDDETQSGKSPDSSENKSEDIADNGIQNMPQHEVIDEVESVKGDAVPQSGQPSDSSESEDDDVADNGIHNMPQHEVVDKVESIKGGQEAQSGQLSDSSESEDEDIAGNGIQNMPQHEIINEQEAAAGVEKPQSEQLSESSESEDEERSDKGIQNMPHHELINSQEAAKGSQEATSKKVSSVDENDGKY